MAKPSQAVYPDSPLGGQHTRLSHAEVAIYRDTLQRILDSQGFSGSRRLSEFLSYVVEEAIKGRASLDQYEIAEHVLSRPEEFDPLVDASVRKLASQVRHKLEEFYEIEGASDPVIVTLPRRSYVPRFRSRDKMLPTAAKEVKGSSGSEALQVNAATSPDSKSWGDIWGDIGVDRGGCMGCPATSALESCLRPRHDLPDCFGCLPYRFAPDGKALFIRNRAAAGYS